MSRTVFCKKYQEELEALDNPPFPGPRGQAIFDSSSKKAWQAWQQHQTMLINEKHLNLMDQTARAYINEQMDKFLSGEEYDAADGYVPPEAS